MKKGFIFFLTFLFFNAAIFAEQIQSQQNEETVQTISWEIVENANKYQVEIEKFNSSIDSENQWGAFYTETTSLSQVEVTFIPGRYRIKVMPVNILGRVVDQGQWLKFRILTEAEWAEWEKQHSKGENQPVFEDEIEDDNQDTDIVSSLTREAERVVNRKYACVSPLAAYMRALCQQTFCATHRMEEGLKGSNGFNQSPKVRAGGVGMV